MSNVASTPDRAWLKPVLWGVGLLTLYRVFALWWGQLDLFVDEAQYWFWGQELAFGYYSKPPMIGWVIRAFVEAGGSDAAFWIRLPAPLFHAATALILGAIAREHLGHRAAIATALGYITLPVIAVGSTLISTDTIMFPFLALALGGYLRLVIAPSRNLALFTGAMLGLAFLSKYAAIYYVLCAGIVALALPLERLRLRDYGLILLAFVITISPNILWNVANGFSTLQHTADNADWVRDPSTRAGLNLIGLTEFFAAQFAVMGPLVFAALLTMGWHAIRGQLTLVQVTLLLFALPIIAVVCVQALLSEAYANWAAAASVAGVVAVMSWLIDRPGWLRVSFWINGAVSVILPILTLFAGSLTLNGKTLLFERYVGLDEMSEQIFEVAEQAGQDVIVASNRDILANLFYTAKGRDFTIYAAPVEGRAPHHYALKHPYDGDDATVLYVQKQGRSRPCPTDTIIPIIGKVGKYETRPYRALIIEGACLK
ncbi:MAG: glycosyltransferase family 39 protein [Pseudomonadota bacterium]